MHFFMSSSSSVFSTVFFLNNTHAYERKKDSPWALSSSLHCVLVVVLKYSSNKQEVQLRLVYLSKHQFTQQQLSPVQPQLFSDRPLSTQLHNLH